MGQTWDDLLFAHWRVSADAVLDGEFFEEGLFARQDRTVGSGDRGQRADHFLGLFGCEGNRRHAKGMIHY